MGRNRHKDVKENEENEATIKELKAANRRLKSDNERLKAELSTLQEAFSKTSAYLKGNTDGMSVEKIIEGVKKGSTLAEIKKKENCEKCGNCSIKEFFVKNVGKIILCSDCKFRKVVKHEK
jgi:hypothetical protein